MRAPLARRIVGTLVVILVASTAHAQGQETQRDESVALFLAQLEEIFTRADPAAYFNLLHGSAANDRARAFLATEMERGATHVVIQERDRQGFVNFEPGTGYRVMVDAFIEHGDRARVATWQLDLLRSRGGPWKILDQERQSSIESIYRLSLSTTNEYAAHDFRITAEDFDIVLQEGNVFTIDTDQGVTGLVLLGRGEMRFHPAPETEKQQVKIFAKKESLVSRFDAAYVRTGFFEKHASKASLVPRAVDPRDVKRAERVFREESRKSFIIDLSDLTRDTWSVLPGTGDFLAEVRTHKFGTLTYARSESDAEDISLFNRKKSKNISVYSSAERLATRGRFYSEDDQVAYDVLNYDIDVTVSPDRPWVEGTAEVQLRCRRVGVGQLTLRLANSLVVRSIISDKFGRLFNLRLVNQDAVIVNLPETLSPGDEITMTITYAGLVQPQDPERENLALQPARGRDLEADLPYVEFILGRPEPSFLYSNRTYWYPQAPVTDYATATIRVKIPALYDCVATGTMAPGSPTISGEPLNLWKTFVFKADRPARYLSLLVTRLERVRQMSVVFDGSKSARLERPQDDSPSPSQTLDLSIAANPRQTFRVKSFTDKAVDIAQFYQSLMSDSPYDSFTLALVENMLPGGHSPAYFAQLNQPLPRSMLSWRGDPAVFEGFSDFFLAHELAHQWWGQAVGWQNYHEQWLSEGFAQYFAALYARHSRGDELFESVLRQMRRWAIDESDQGPIYLGYRLGHVRGEGRIFRAIVYNKGAVVLQILRELVGDDAFFRGLRRFYSESKFTKTSTDALRVAMENESGRHLENFFDRWIYGSSLPRLKFGYHMEGNQVVLRAEQVGEIFDVPLTLTLRYTDGRNTDVVMPIAERSAEMRIPLTSSLRGVDVSRNDLSLASISRIQ